MKRAALLLAATAAMALTSTLASAQPYGGRNDGRNDGRGYNDNRNGGYNNRNDNRGGQRWQRGQRLDNQYRSRDRVFNDYGRYRLSPPPRGYSYYRTDTGDIILAAIATGVISSVIGGLLAGDGGGYSGYGQPAYANGYAQPGYSSGYVQPGYSSSYSSTYVQPGYSSSGQVYYDGSGRAYTVDAYGRSVWVR